MATVAQSSSASRPAKAPISAHPAFPAIVALWFAALLGLGSLVLPVALIERFVNVTRIASLIPSAEPPLGFTARAGIALAASIAGALVGLLLARQVAKASTIEPQGRSFAPVPQRQCRPISARDELGEDGLDSPTSPSSLPTKRRSLAMAEDNQRSAYLQAVPLPGQSSEELAELPTSDEMSSSGRSPANEPIVEAEAETEPLELETFVAPEEAEDEFETLRPSIHTPDALAQQDSAMTDPTFDPAAIKPERKHIEPLPFAAPSLRRSLTPVFDEEEDEEAEAEADLPENYTFDEAGNDDVFADEPGPQLAIAELQGDPNADDRPVEELGLVQLAARLGASIEKRRAWLAERQGAVPASRVPLAPFGDGEDFETAEAEDAARAIADFFGPAGAVETSEMAKHFDIPAAQPTPAAASVPLSQTAMPAALRSMPFDDEADDEDAGIASFSLPLGGFLADTDPASDGEAEEFDEEEPDDGDYSSLLAMKNPFARQQEFVRVEEPEDESGSIEPTVTFPAPSPDPLEGTAHESLASVPRLFDPPRKPVESAIRPAPAAVPRDPGEAERSLRDALATLQRMSGAA